MGSCNVINAFRFADRETAFLQVAGPAQHAPWMNGNAPIARLEWQDPSLEPPDAEGQFVRPFDDFARGCPDSSSQISDHNSGDIFAFKTSLSSLSGVREAFEDVSDIVHPSIVRVT